MTTTTALMPYSTDFSWAGIGYRGVTFPNGTGTPLVAADAGKTIGQGTAGLELAADGGIILGVLFDLDADGTVTCQDAGYALVTMATDAVAVDDYVVGNGTGGIKPNGTSGSTTASTAIAVYKVSATSMWIKIFA